MATLRMTAGAVFDTAVVAAGAATNLVNALGSGAKMLNATIDHASWKQDQSLKVDRVHFKDNMLTQKTIEIAQSRKALSDYKAANSDQAELLSKIWSELEEALA